MKTHQVQQKTERRISAALRLVFVAALLLGQIALAFFLSTELRQRAAIIYTVLELAAFGYAVRIYNRTDGTSYKFGWIFLVLTCRWWDSFYTFSGTVTGSKSGWI